MKLKNTFPVLFILCTLGCNEADPLFTPLEPQMTELRFTVLLNQTVQPFPATKTMPPFEIPEPRSGPEDSPRKITDVCTRIEYIVYESGQSPTIFKQKNFVQGVDADFGIISDALPEGEYTVVIVAHSSEEASVEGQAICFDNQLTDTFHYALELTIYEMEYFDAIISLRRVVSKVQFKSTEAVPDNLETLCIEVDNFPGKLDVFTGQGLTSEDLFLYTHSFTAAEKGKNDMTHDFLCFDPTDNATMEVTLTATNTTDDITRTWDLSVDPKANQMICYSGCLYTSDANNENIFRLQIKNGGNWGETINEELK